MKMPGCFSSSLRRLVEWGETFWDEVPGASLAVSRIVFGTLMLFDLQEERGMPVLDERFGDPDECRFPLFPSWKLPPLEYIALAYLVMVIALVAVTLGVGHFRLWTAAYSVIYWAIFLADKTRWNNHSYLYGLISLLFAISSADRCLSWSTPMVVGAVPRWNYLIIKFQICLVYFYAGLKKIDLDWICGRSMVGLGGHWVWAPLRAIGLTEWFVELFVVHIGGLVFDLTAAFLMLWPPTRVLGSLLTVAFNFLNSRMFPIGMFPYVMIAFVPIFFDYDWPIKLWRAVKRRGDESGTESVPPLKSNSRRNSCAGKPASAPGWDPLVSGFLLTFVAVQVALPFTSSWIFPGFDTWTGGLYGHQWNMMVHNWRPGHVSFEVRHVPSNRTMYLDHNKLTSRGGRWVQQADMVWQFAQCVKARLARERNLTNIEVRADVWMSLNGRFMQRMFDPRVDLISARWSPLDPVPWVVPVQRQFEYLRPLATFLEATQDVRHEVSSNHSESPAISEFFVDVPGMAFTNFVPTQLNNVRLAVLTGKILLKTGDCEQAVGEGQVRKIPSGAPHSISTVSRDPSVLVYRYENITSPAATNAACPATTSTVYSRLGRHIKLWVDSFSICWWALQRISGLDQ